MTTTQTNVDNRDLVSIGIEAAYLYVALALFVTGSVTYFTLGNETLINALSAQGPMGWVAAIGMGAVILILSVMISAFAQAGENLIAEVLLFLFAVVMGVFIAPYVYQFTLDSVIKSVYLTGGISIVACAIGVSTKIDLTRFTGALSAALLALLAVSIVNTLIFGFEQAELLFSAMFAALFTVMISVHAQKLKHDLRDIQASHGDMSRVRSIALQAAMLTYLDILNLFLRILAIMGQKRK